MKMIPVPSAFRAAQDLEQVLRLLGGQHRGRLVEHEHLRPAEQRAQDLDALLGADAEVLHAGVGVDGEAEALRELARPRRRLLVVEQRAALRGSAPSTRFSATVITGTSMKCWCTMPMPSPIALRDESIVTFSPPSRISPSSGCRSP